MAVASNRQFNFPGVVGLTSLKYEVLRKYYTIASFKQIRHKDDRKSSQDFSVPRRFLFHILETEFL